MPLRNTVTWTSLIKGYVDNEDYRAMLEALVEMHKVGENFNEHTCSVILQACSSHGDLLLGVQIHGFVMKCAFDKNVYVSTPLISLYSRSGHLREAEKIYSSIASKDVRCLNFMILEYGNRGCGEKAMEVFINMLSTDFKPNDYSFTNIISTCNENLGAEEGMQLHGLAIKFGCIDEMSVGNAVIALYGKNGMLEEVETMFAAMSDRNLITWTTLISSYILNGLYHEAFDAFSEFRGLAVNYDSNLFSTILKGCSEWRNLGLGVQMHGLVTKFGFLYDTAIVAVLVELYAKCGKLQTARIMFRSVGNNPDCVSFSRLFSISATQTSLASGKALHAYAIKAGYEKDVYVSNSMITMYAKCGSLEDAHQIFSAINDHDIVSWNALVSAYGLHGKGQSALLLFGQMKEMGIAPDEITLLATLQACSYSGLWKDGIHLFNLMEAEYGIQPLVEHYSCMVVCKLRGDMNFGKLASKKLLDLSPDEAESYILVSNMYAERGMLSEAARVRTIMNDLNLYKEAGTSWIEIDNKCHHFVASARDHPQIKEIYCGLDILTNEMRQKFNGIADISSVWCLYNQT
ncbi:Pentatricopeptide repeat-containing protein At2g27610 [Linum perenne]